MALPKVAQLIDVEVGARIRQRRKLLGMSQTGLAEKIGVTFQQVQKYEKGSNRVGSSRLHQIAGVLGIEPAALFDQVLEGREPTTREAAVLEQMMVSPEGVALNRAFAKLSDVATRKSVIALVKAIAAEADPT